MSIDMVSAWIIVALPIVGVFAEPPRHAPDRPVRSAPAVVVSPLTPPARYALPPQSLRATVIVARGVEPPRLADRGAVHDPFQFAAVRALRFDRGRYRPSPIDAKLEFRLAGGDRSLDLIGGVPGIVRRALR